MKRGLVLALLGPLALGATEPSASATQVHYVMGTLWTIEAEGPRVQEALDRAFAEIRRIDARFSTYKPESELSRVNRDAAKGWVPVSSETHALLGRTFGYARSSAGAFDPTVGPLVEAWGFKHLDFHMPKPEVLDSARQRVGYARVQLDPVRGVRFARRGMSLDLGAIAKGYAVDRALDGLRRAGMIRARVDAGGNQGVFGRPVKGDRWRFGVKHPRDPDGVLGVVGLQEGAISTSGDAERGFWHQGVRYGHILNARTGRPATGLLSVTVVAPTAEEADALSTTLYVLGPVAGPAYLARYHPQARALYVEDATRIRPQDGLDWTPALDSYDPE